jgi:hypothetical protein
MMFSWLRYLISEKRRLEEMEKKLKVWKYLLEYDLAEKGSDPEIELILAVTNVCLGVDDEDFDYQISKFSFQQ